MRESWTDERLDDFRGEVNRRFDEVDRRLGDMDSHLARIDTRLDGIQRAILAYGLGGVVTVVIGFLGLILTHA
jgi:hypothetical protein